MRLAIAVMVMVAAETAAADELRVAVRQGSDALALERLAGQIVDLEVEVIEVDGELEATLDQQIAAAQAMEAGAVVWFRREGEEIVVVVAMPEARRVFVRTIDAGDESATAEAAAQAARTAIRAIALGGTIGVEMPAETPAERARVRWNGGAGWQAAIDGGADWGAHAVWQRLGVSRGAWGGSIALSLGPPLRRDGEVDVELSRSSVIAAAEMRRGAWRFALGAGVAVYHRATVDVPGGLEATDSQVQAALDVAPEVRWAFGGRWGIEIAVGVDVVVGAPEMVIDRGGMLETVANIATFQPRIGVGIVVGP